ncbi:hypothetical protein SDRG_05112 [Saprolegnia diclina VS20]|uniref:Uncharacterized protein n=1 Tax=Saprolegnia diclina (strain VS20) TaxID=1156394 RepID=T0QHT3_SAPDV|nr:hypothetical protein SDRG_05112 [Saprolegnia diclina VS20]EQC37509.1 hypothetical protein SDRG_05112 [Saprolegnia diclina VS20]|eukprot:XP_008609029.1 hypothetical protein SDRG_05112 [Saprolegnia diclina VS20]
MEKDGDVVVDTPIDATDNNHSDELNLEVTPEFAPRLELLHQLQASEEDAAKGAQLCAASKEGAIDTVRKLVLENAPVGFVTTSGWTPLAFACFNGRLEVVQYFLELGAADNYKPTPSITGEKCKPAQVNTPLHWAIYKGHPMVVYTLVTWGFSIEDADSCGNRALHLACSNGTFTIIEIILSHAPDLAAKNVYGNTPMDLTTDGAVRKLLKKMQTQTMCDECHDVFSRSRRATLCQQCHNLVCNVGSCSSSLEIPWGTVDKSVHSVRYCHACVQALAQVEADLEQVLTTKRLAVAEAMAPLAALEASLATFTPAPKPGTPTETEALGGVEQPPPTPISKGSLVKQLLALLLSLESNNADVEALQTAIVAASEKKANAWLLQEARATYEQHIAHIQLIQEIKAALATRPISTRSLVAALRRVWRQAQVEGVEGALVQAAQRVIVLAESEASLYGAYMLCARIQVGSAQFSNDFVRLNHCLTMVEDYGVSDTLMRNAWGLRDRLSAEMTLEAALFPFEERMDGLTNQSQYVFHDGKIAASLLEALTLRNHTLTVAVEVAAKVEEATPVASHLVEKAKECLVKLKKDIKEEQKREDERRRIAEEEALKAAKKGKKGKKGGKK